MVCMITTEEEARRCWPMYKSGKSVDECEEAIKSGNCNKMSRLGIIWVDR
jgi:hypothetical protein